MNELCSLTGMDKSRTTSYHPMGNGQCERFNISLLDLLNTLEPTQRKNWKSYVGPLVHSYNCTRDDSTGFSPDHLMFGREPRLPVDDAFGIRKDKSFHGRVEYVIVYNITGILYCILNLNFVCI